MGMLFAVRTFFAAHAWAKWAAGAALVALVLTIAAWRLYAAGQDDIKRDNALAVGEAKVKGAEAREAAAGERAADEAATAAAHEERANATRNLPDARPSDRTSRRRCVQLRQQGHDTSRVPGCVGSDPAREAAPQR